MHTALVAKTSEPILHLQMVNMRASAELRTVQTRDFVRSMFLADHNVSSGRLCYPLVLNTM